jgi:hypothetical protein
MEPKVSPLPRPSCQDLPHRTDSHPNRQTLVVEMEAGEDFVRLVTHPSLEFRFYEPLSPTQQDSTAAIIRRATRCVARLFPRLSQPGAILRTELLPPVTGGHALSSTVQKFLSKVTSRTEMQVPPISLLPADPLPPRASISAGRTSQSRGPTAKSWEPSPPSVLCWHTLRPSSGRGGILSATSSPRLSRPVGSTLVSKQREEQRRED